MISGALQERLCGKYQRTLSTHVWRRPLTMRNATPVISFTFDDFPRSALDIGGAILKAHGAAGTYYAALGLLGRDAPVGRICARDGLAAVEARGHELGCHTFDHCDAWNTRPREFEASILANRAALARLSAGARFATMSYPISSPRPATKRIAGRHFACCRGDGQRLNVGVADLNYLFAFFLEQSRERPAAIKEIIERNRTLRGWLIFVTHDVTSHPSRYGCTPELFERVVGWSAESGARILPVAQALAEVAGGPVIGATSCAAV